ncbi:MAG: fructose-bisphosphatase class II, partial [Conexibacter sp.]
MTETAPVRIQPDRAGVGRYCLCESYARVTERSALSGARWLGRADQDGAELDAADAMRQALEMLPIDGHVVIGAGGDDEMLGLGQRVGAGGEQVDLALDPLEGRGVVARGAGGAMSMIAV